MEEPRVALHWLPLGAGGHCVRLNGRVFEAVAARREGRRPQALFHAALEVTTTEGRYVVEMAPAWAHDDPVRGVALVGPVGARLLGRSVLFRYEVRCWRDGRIPDRAYAVGGPQLLSRDDGRARRLLGLVAEVPAATWGRDEQAAGEMWNSNSVVAWLLARSGHDLAGVAPPAGGRAPGWGAGRVVAARVPTITRWPTRP